MLVLAVKTNKTPKIDNATVLTYDEMFAKYCKQCKKAFWKTDAGMFLTWQECQTIKDMKSCVFVIPGNEETAAHIKKYYHVLDENEIDY